MRFVPAIGGLSGQDAGCQPRLAQRARSRVWWRRRPAADRGPGPGPTRRQSHRPAIHRGCRGAAAVPHTDQVWLRPRNVPGGSERRIGTDWRSHHQRRALLAAGQQPRGGEATTCRTFLAAEIAGLQDLRAILALGRIAHNSVVAALGLRQTRFPFGHGASHTITKTAGGGLVLTDSYHCSQYNVNTGRLTPEMFEAVFAELRERLVHPSV